MVGGTFLFRNFHRKSVESKEEKEEEISRSTHAKAQTIPYPSPAQPLQCDGVCGVEPRPTSPWTTTTLTLTVSSQIGSVNAGQRVGSGHYTLTVMMDRARPGLPITIYTPKQHHSGGIWKK